jgi:ubiquinone/menaquinone biosynthesis C-methylase UbiE
MSGTSDHFSGHASAYAHARPSYPSELFDWLASQCPERSLAWDCGTGNGQAAGALAGHFGLVHATDLSSEQLAQATPNRRVNYVCTPAEMSGLEDQSCDLVTVAQALHWFCNDAFYREVNRVLKPNGLIAAWTYTLLDAEPQINALIADFHQNTVGPWWPAERKWVDLGYAGMLFPFDEVSTPQFTIFREWDLSDVMAYLRTWSASQRYMKATGTDPVTSLGEQLAGLWEKNCDSPSGKRTIRWPLAIRCGRKRK